MANNFKSKEVQITTDSTVNLLTCTTTSAIVSSITLQMSDGGTMTKGILKFYKSGGGSNRSVVILKAPGAAVEDLLTKSFVMESSDQFQFQSTGLNGTAVLTVHYMERTADVSTQELSDLTNVSGTDPSDGQFLVYSNALGQWTPQTLSGANLGEASDTGDLPEDTIGAEPRNRYMKGLNGLDDLTDNSSNLPAHVLYSDPTNIHFVVENNSLSTPVVQKVTWDQLIKSIIEVGVNDLVAAGYGDIDTYSPNGIVGDLNGDGDVSTADLLEFLTMFGQGWLNAAGSFWQATVAEVNNGGLTNVTSSITVLNFDTQDVTVTQGTQAVTVSGAGNSITIESGTSETPISALSTKQLKVFTDVSTDAFTVVTSQSNERVEYYLLVDCYDDSDVQVGSTVQYNFATGFFGAAGTFTTGTVGSADYGAIPLGAFTNAGITDGLANTSIEKLVVKFGAKTDNGTSTLVNINNLDIRLVNG